MCFFFFFFQEMENVITCQKAKRLVQLYNSLATVFVQYEILHHKSWYEQAEELQRSLAVPLLARNPQTKRLAVYFDPYVVEVMQETEYMWKLGRKIPDIAQTITSSKKKMLSAVENVKHLVAINDNIR